MKIIEEDGRVKKKHRKLRTILIVLICLDGILCLSIFLIRRYQNTEKYILNTVYKEKIEQFISEKDELQGGSYTTYIITKCDGVSYIKQQSILDNDEKKTVAAICKNGKWDVTNIEGEDALSQQMNDNLLIQVEEKMLSKEAVVAIYDQDLNIIGKVNAVQS